LPSINAIPRKLERLHSFFSASTIPPLLPYELGQEVGLEPTRSYDH
jgi:hypothetical protein